MKRLMTTTLIACLAILMLLLALQAQASAASGQLERATPDEALTVAKNWIAVIVQATGHWGRFPTAQVETCQTFEREKRLLGYFCPVLPQGFIVVSLYKELEPIKAYSEIGNLDPKSDEGLADLIKGGMERILDGIEAQVGPLDAARVQAVESVLEINYRYAWEALSQGGVAVAGRQPVPNAMTMNYQEGDVMLSSHWEQGEPYNNFAPSMGCTQTTNGRAWVGCGSTAASQIMRYWAWPPYGVGSPYDDTYDWPHMTDTIGTGSPANEINAVAELGYEVGLAVSMTYGCAGSSANMNNVEAGLENTFRYTTAIALRARQDYTAIDWFNRMKTQLNANRPIFYRVENHFIVADGWREVGITPTRQYHMNYGWGMTGTCQNGCDTWYTLDALNLGGLAEEYMHENIFPAPSLGSSVSGIYGWTSFPYRYFDRDATGSSATFVGPQNLQFLSGVKVTSSGTIRFSNASSEHLVLFTRGDLSRGIRISGNGVIKLNNGGSVKLR